MNIPIPKRMFFDKGVRRNSTKPSRKLPDIEVSLYSDEVVFSKSVALILLRKIAMVIGINSITAEIRTRVSEPTCPANKKAIVGPKMAPRLLPDAINPKSRLACVFEYVSAIKLQNTEIFNKLKTLTHT